MKVPTEPRNPNIPDYQRQTREARWSNRQAAKAAAERQARERTMREWAKAQRDRATMRQAQSPLSKGHLVPSPSSSPHVGGAERLKFGDARDMARRAASARRVLNGKHPQPMSWRVRGALARMTGLRMAGNLHPWVRAAKLLLEMYDLWSTGELDAYDPAGEGGGLYAPGYALVQMCGPPGGGPVTDGAGWPACGTWAVQKGLGIAAARPVTIWQWGRFVSQPTNPLYANHAAGWRYNRVEVNGPAVRYAPPFARFSPWPAPFASPDLGPVPYALLPDRVADPITGPFMNNGNKPPRRPYTRPVPKRGSGGSEKEQKAKVPKWFAPIVVGALTATEAADLIDALFDALPDDIKARTRKSGVTSPSAQHPGRRYSNHGDKGRAVFQNLDKMNWNKAMANVLMNHYSDKLVGGVMGKADGVRDLAGGIGWGYAHGPQSWAAWPGG